jgi:hypothetical protein
MVTSGEPLVVRKAGEDAIRSEHSFRQHTALKSYRQMCRAGSGLRTIFLETYACIRRESFQYYKAVWSEIFPKFC